MRHVLAMRWARGLAVVVGMALGGVVRGEINIVDSLEWMVADSPVIVEGKVGEVRETAGPGSVIYRDVTVVEGGRVLKGDVKPEGLEMRVRTFKGEETGANWKKSGDRYLFFLMAGKKEDDAALEGKWVPRERQGAIDLDHPSGVYLASMKNGKTREEILKVVEAWRQWKPAGGATRPMGTPNVFEPQWGFVRMEVAGDSEIYHQVWAGSVCYINVPAEEKHRAEALALVKAGEAWKRQKGAAMLQSYPGPETYKVLRELLADKGEQQENDGRGKLTIVYPVRAAAYQVLTSLGEKVEKPVIERAATEAEVRAWEAGRK